MTNGRDYTRHASLRVAETTRYELQDGNGDRVQREAQWKQFHKSATYYRVTGKPGEHRSLKVLDKKGRAEGNTFGFGRDLETLGKVFGGGSRFSDRDWQAKSHSKV
jgi:hypothetical protein